MVDEVDESRRGVEDQIGDEMKPISIIEADISDMNHSIRALGIYHSEKTEKQEK